MCNLGHKSLDVTQISCTQMIINWQFLPKMVKIALEPQAPGETKFEIWNGNHFSCEIDNASGNI